MHLVLFMAHQVCALLKFPFGKCIIVYLLASCILAQLLDAYCLAVVQGCRSWALTNDTVRALEIVICARRYMG